MIIKLVRDKIPEILEKEGKKFKLRIVQGEEKLKYLIEKLKEEINEFEKSKSIEEIVDMLEVIESIVKELNYTIDQVIKLKEVKRNERGGFDKGYVIEIYD